MAARVDRERAVRGARRQVRDSMKGLTVKAMYSLGQLARASGMDYRTLKAFLGRAGVRIVQNGRCCLVSLDDLERKVPPLWKGIQAAEALRRSVESDG